MELSTSGDDTLIPIRRKACHHGDEALSVWLYAPSLFCRDNVNAIHVLHEPFAIARLIMSNIFDTFQERILARCQNKKTNGAFLSICISSICQA